jgi:hypothetical protein
MYTVTLVPCLHRGQNDGLAERCFSLLVIEIPCMTVSNNFHTSGSLAWTKKPLVPLEHRADWVGSTECLEVLDKKEVPDSAVNRTQIPQTSSRRLITKLTEL